MATGPFQYQKTPVDLNRLTLEIGQSTISIALDHIDGLGTPITSVTIYFKADISDAELGTLNALVAAHTGQPLLQNVIQPVSIQQQPPVTILSAPPLSPFAAKTYGTKRLFKRIHGIMATCTIGSANQVLFVVPYAWVKITGLELINADLGTTASFFVLDSDTGIATGGQYPGMVLNQFAFTLNVGQNFYQYMSEYDADLYGGMKLRVDFAVPAQKTLGINFIMNEVK